MVGGHETPQPDPDPRFLEVYRAMSPEARRDFRLIMGEFIDWTDEMLTMEEDEVPDPTRYPHLTEFREAQKQSSEAGRSEEVAVQRAKEVLR